MRSLSSCTWWFSPLSVQPGSARPFGDNQPLCPKETASNMNCALAVLASSHGSSVARIVLVGSDRSGRSASESPMGGRADSGARVLQLQLREAWDCHTVQCEQTLSRSTSKAGKILDRRPASSSARLLPLLPNRRPHSLYGAHSDPPKHHQAHNIPDLCHNVNNGLRSLKRMDMLDCAAVVCSQSKMLHGEGDGLAWTSCV